MDKNKLSPWEAKRNLKEIAQEIDQDHLIEVENKISDAIFEEINLNYGDTLDEEVDFSSDFLFCFSDYWLIISSHQNLRSLPDGRKC